VRPLPPLNALRAFEATARHLSFTKAAEELHVTPAALSHQIRGLEDVLGLKLFHRRARSIELTEPARLIYPGIRTGFEAIREAVERLGRGQQDRVLVVSSTPGFTAKWLVPRLYRFFGQHPDIEARITASVAYANFTSDGVDVGIRLSSGVHPDLYVEKLSDEWLLPLCSPRLLNGDRPLQSPHDLAHFPLIQVDLPGIVPTWVDWLRMAGIEGIDGSRGLRLNVADHALDAASEGMGVVLAYKMVAARDIVLNRLVAPFGPEIPVPGRAYYFVCGRGQERRTPVKAFRDWVFAEMEETNASLKAALARRLGRA
jgi:LysR family glycine cleavage system transcriptional activator